MPLTANQNVNLTAETIKALEIVDKLEKNLEQEPVKDLEANDMLKQIRNVLTKIKEQNDEIIGDEF